MIAHVSDFGISKLLVGDDNSVTLTSMPGFSLIKELGSGLNNYKELSAANSEQ
jgi:hypothetical protein